jgi:hypothetical protein
MEAVGRTPVDERKNLVHWFAGRVHQVLDDVMGLATATGEAGSVQTPVVCVASLGPDETAESLVELAEARSRMEGLEASLLTHAESVEVAAVAGATSTAAWVADKTRATRREANRAVRLAKRLSSGGFEATAVALLTGEVDKERALVVVDAVDALPAAVGPEERQRAEAHLLEEAARHNAKDLTRLGRHLHLVIDPDGADAELAKKLDAEERDAARRTMLKLFDDGRGTCHGTFRMRSADGSKLAKALDALASPKRPDAIPRDTVGEDGIVRPVSAPELLGQAFCQFVDRFPVDGLPIAGGSNATVVVMIPLETLRGGLQAASLDTGGQLSPAQARVLGCQANLLPAVCGGKSEILELGRIARLFSKAQRVVMAQRDKGCTALGCTIPAAWCHAHHKTAWSKGGKTNVDDGTLLCPRHHTLVHHPDYSVTYRSDGKTQISRTSRRRQ